MMKEKLPVIDTAPKTIKKEWVKPEIEIITTSVESGHYIGSGEGTHLGNKTHMYVS